MRNAVTVVVALLLVMGGTAPPTWAWQPAAPKGRFRSLQPAEAKELIETKDGLILIDVRTHREYSQGALPGSVLIPANELKLGRHDLPKERPILIVCAVGSRSYDAALYLYRQGYQEVYNLAGGLSAWAQQRVPLPSKRVSTAP